MTQPVQEPSDQRAITGTEYRTRQLARRPALTPPSGAIEQEIKVFFDDEVVTVFDWKFPIPAGLHEAALVGVEAYVSTVSGGGNITIQIRNETQGLNMLSTVVTIPAGDQYDNNTHVINTANDDVVHEDEIFVRVLTAGSGAMGLVVVLQWMPAATATLLVQGAKGDPGGVTSFQGAWQDATGYQAGDVVTHNGILYVALQNHTSNAANDEPGVGTNEDDFWAPAFDVPLSAAAGVNIISSSGAVPDGIFGSRRMPFNASIVGWVMLADRTTDGEIDVLVTDFAGYPPSSGDSITGGNPAALSAALKNQDNVLTGWTTALNEGDIITFSVSGVTDARRLTLDLILEK